VFSSAPTDGFALASKIKGLLVKAAGIQMPEFKLPTICGKFTKADTAESLYQLITSVLTDISKDDPDVLHVIGQEDMQSMQDGDEMEWRTSLNNALNAKKLKLTHYP